MGQRTLGMQHLGRLQWTIDINRHIRNIEMGMFCTDVRQRASSRGCGPRAAPRESPNPRTDQREPYRSRWCLHRSCNAVRQRFRSEPCPNPGLIHSNGRVVEEDAVSSGSLAVKASDRNNEHTTYCMYLICVYPCRILQNPHVGAMNQ